jgi:glycosyltransferase involved in cell wall biosynthesis
MKKQIFSVAMCTYNGVEFLPEQLKSLAAQTRLPDELVIYDDCSQDDTIKIIQAFAATAPFSVQLVVNDANLGSTKNFEQAIQLCQGHLIALSDQDDIWLPQKLEKLETCFEQYPGCGYVFSDTLMINEIGQVVTQRSLWQAAKFQSEQFKQADAYQQVKMLLKHERVTGATMAFRASLKSLILPISPFWIHDGWITLLASAAGFYGVPISEPLIYYRLHTAQQTAIGRETMFERYHRSRTVKGEAYQKQAQRFFDVNSRLVSGKIIGIEKLDIVTDLIKKKARHLLARASIHSTNRAARLKIVMAELFAGHYHQFSDAGQCLIKDIFL